MKFIKSTLLLVVIMVLATPAMAVDPFSVKRLPQLKDVDAASVVAATEGMVLRYDATGGKWVATGGFTIDGDGNVTVVGTFGIDGEYTFPAADGTNGQTLQTNGSGTVSWSSAGAGDVTGAGDCTSGDCYDGSSDGGTYARIYDGDSHYLELNPGDLSDNRAIAFRDGSGTAIISGDTLTGDVTAAFDTDGTTATSLANDVVAADEMADADHGDVAWSAGIATVQDFALVDNADAGDYDITSIDKLEGYDPGIYIDLGADGVVEIASDGTIKLLASDEDITIADGGTNLITLSTNTDVTEINTTLHLVTTGHILGGVNVSSKTADYTVGTDDTEEAYGTLFLNGDDDAQTFTLPTAVAGMACCFLNGQGVTAALTVTPAAGDYLVSDGVRGTAATAYASSGAAGDKICIVAADATDWYIMSETGTWSE